MLQWVASPPILRLNALSGIGGVRTPQKPYGHGRLSGLVLMPCRALEAFGPISASPALAPASALCLNALSGIGGVRTMIKKEKEERERKS
mgnify:CR=1 FL=1